MRRKQWPRVRPRVRGERIDYCIDCGVMGGRRRQEFKATMEEAEARAQEIRDEYDRLGCLAKTLTQDQVLTYAQAEGKLSAVGATIEEAVDSFLSIRERNATGKTVSVVQSELVAAQIRDGLRPASIHSTRTRYSGFLAAFGDRHVADLQSNEVSDWIDAQDYGLTRRANVIRYLNCFFNYAVRREYIDINPMAKIKRPKLAYKVPEFVRADHVAALMHLAHADKDAANLVPKLAVGFFAGIRPDEVDRMDWSDISFDNRTIRMRPEVTKCGVPRLVPMSANLVEWLMLYRKPSGSLGLQKKAFGIHRRRLMTAADIADWPNSAWRHTFATYHLAMHEDAQETARVMGHIHGVELLYKRYANAMISRDEAVTFWGISPEQRAGEVAIFDGTLIQKAG